MSGLRLQLLGLVLGCALPMTSAQLPLDSMLAIEELDGETWCTVEGSGVLITELIEELADRLELTVIGLAEIPADARADLYLQDRRVSEVLSYVLGRVGMRAERRSNRLTITSELREDDQDEREQLLELAALAYLRVTRKFPDHPEVPRILLEQARISRSLVRQATARSQFEELVNRFPFADVTPTALYELGQLLMEIGDYGSAAQELAELLRFERGTETEKDARLQLAHCRAELGQYEDALLILQALDSKTPPRSREDRQERAYSRARFLIGLERPEEALESLDRADSFGITDGRIRRIALRLRAQALEGLERPAEASRAWLTYHTEVEGSDRGYALARAADNALACGRGEDLLAVVFIAHLAEDSDLREATAEQLLEARRRLGLGEPTAGQAPQRALVVAAELIATGHHAEALVHLENARGSRHALSQRQTLELTRLYATSLAEEQDIDQAAAFLRLELEEFEESRERKEIYLIAADLFNQHGRWTAEIEALQGRL